MKKIPKSFTTFLIISVLIWMVINLSRSYNQTIVIDVVYNDLPQDKIYNTIPPSNLSIEVRGTGFSLFVANFSQDKISVSLKNLVKKEKGLYSIPINFVFKQVQNQLGSGLKLIDLGQATVDFNLGTLATKKVPVVPNLSLNYKIGFETTGVEVSPEFVVISGVKEKLKSIDKITLEKREFQAVSRDFKDLIPVVVPDGVRVSEKNVSIAVKVDRFTEGEVELPVKIRNIGRAKLSVYPNTVKVVYRVRLKNFSKVTPEMFHIEADYRFSKQNDLTYLVPKLKTKSKLLTVVRMVPDKIDFLIQK